MLAKESGSGATRPTQRMLNGHPSSVQQFKSRYLDENLLVTGPVDSGMHKLGQSPA